MVKIKAYKDYMWREVESFDTLEEALKRIGELEGKYKLEVPEEILRTLPAKEKKSWEIPKESISLGTVWQAYGDEHYYILPDGSYAYDYFKIGD